MRYISTRGTAPTLSFNDVLLTGLARDGGLYVPEAWPQFSATQLREMATLNYVDLAVEVIWPFVEGDIDRADLETLVSKAYRTFSHQAVAPLVQVGQHHYMMELFHGPTLAFKDFALQLVGQLFDHVLKQRGERLTVVGATSGDTGSAAIEACKDRDQVDIFILYPTGRVSPVQQRQMTTVASSNVYALSVEGDFDTCQDLVKAMFNDQAFRDEVGLGAVNSINWARIMGQIVYYFWAALQLGAPDRAVNFAVPTGNFGNVFAGYAAKNMGLPIEWLGVSSNRNDILTRFFERNDMSLAPVEPSHSPSMDIQVSSNFERLLFDLMGRDGKAVAQAIQDFRANGRLDVGQGGWEQARALFDGYRLDDPETLAAMADWRVRTNGQVLDPHTVIGVDHAARRAPTGTPVVSLATAHPAKFPSAVDQALAVDPALPPHMADLYEREERVHLLPSDLATLQDFVRGNRRT